jgi:hypothetical protein
MMQSHSCQFKVQTPLPQLANRAIQQILVELKAVNLVGQNGQYLAHGFIQREIRYTDPDGRVRKIDDQLQFEVDLGEVEPASVVLPLTKLCQDYFVFQSQPSGSGQSPTLEQGLTLTFQGNTAAAPPTADVAHWWLNQIIKQGTLSRLCEFTVTIPEDGIRPMECTAQYIVDSNRHGSLLGGLLKGTIDYVGRGYQLLPFEQTFSFLAAELPAERDGEVVLVPQVTDVAWRPGDLSRNEWRFEAILEFKWYLIKPTVLTCVKGSTAVGLPIVKLRATQPLAERQLRFERTITRPMAKKLFAELKVALQSQTEVWTKEGLLLTANLQVEIFYAQPTGMEAYQQWAADCHQLVTEGLPIGVDSTAKLHATVAVAVQKYVFLGGELRIELILTYDLRFWRNCLVEVVRTPDSTCRVLAETQTAPQVFTTFEQTEFALDNHPVQIHEVKTVLSQMSCIPQTGKVDVQGQQETWVSYCDREHRQHTDLFRHSWRAGFVWGEIDPAVQIMAQAQLIFDRYTAEGSKLNYQFWWDLQLTATRLQEVPIALGPEPPVILPNPVGSNDTVKFAAFNLEREIRLRWGLPRTIAADRTSIGQFYWRQAGQALLVYGRIDSVLEYWDRGGVLRQNCQTWPFWQFVPGPLAEAAVSATLLLQPYIKKYVYQPIGIWPITTGRMKLLVELELQLKGSDGGPNEDFDAKSDRFTDGGSRRYDPSR